jgi:putative inorganic carbon (HCO3(-)) transporter
LPIFGYASPLGGNHNALAEVLLLSAPLALAMASLIHSPRMRRLAYGAAVFMVFITLLTFARSAWLALACEVILLSLTSWKVWLREHRKQVLTFLVIAFVPLAVYMTIFSLRAGVQSSTDARAMVTEVSTNLFLGSPWLGVGAGTFLDRLSHVYAYTVEFGSPIESHGVLQKILAETGLVGLAAFLWVMWVITRTILATWRKLERRNSEARVYLLLVAALLGAFVYQLFDTTYWTPRLWLPVGLVLVAGRLFTREPSVDGPNFLNIA